MAHTKAMQMFVLFGLVFTMQRVGAVEFKVGGTGDWSVNNDSNYNQWAQKNRFQVGDSIVFVYQADKDAVLQVNIDDYTNCNTGSPIAKFADGNTSFKFDKSGSYFFISGNKENCLKNERIHIIVMADRSNHSSNGTMATPPAPSPDSVATPPSPPPPGTLEIAPAPAPEGEEAPSQPAGQSPNAASTVVLSAVGSFGAFVGSSLLLAL